MGRLWGCGLDGSSALRRNAGGRRDLSAHSRLSTNRATVRRASGATNSTTGKATSQAVSQALVHMPEKPLLKPTARWVEMPDPASHHGEAGAGYAHARQEQQPQVHGGRGLPRGLRFIPASAEGRQGRSAGESTAAAQAPAGQLTCAVTRLCPLAGSRWQWAHLNKARVCGRLKPTSALGMFLCGHSLSAFPAINGHR